MTTIQQYHLCQQLERNMKAQSGNSHYYVIADLLIIELKKMLNSITMDWSELNTIQIMHIISMCSTHRPIALHSILISVSMQYDKMRINEMATGN